MRLKSKIYCTLRKPANHYSTRRRHANVTPQRWYTLRSTVLNWRNHTNGYNTAIVVWRSSTCRVTKQGKTRCLVTILQLYFGPKVSMTKHGVLWRFYTCVVVLKLVVSMTQHGILLRFYNYRVVIKLVW